MKQTGQVRSGSISFFVPEKVVPFKKKLHVIELKRNDDKSMR
jgi:hypothetical protein